jgi:hypothetical protein
MTKLNCAMAVTTIAWCPSLLPSNLLIKVNVHLAKNAKNVNQTQLVNIEVSKLVEQDPVELFRVYARILH